MCPTLCTNHHLGGDNCIPLPVRISIFAFNYLQNLSTLTQHNFTIVLLGAIASLPTPRSDQQWIVLCRYLDGACSSLHSTSEKVGIPRQHINESYLLHTFPSPHTHTHEGGGPSWLADSFVFRLPKNMTTWLPLGWFLPVGNRCKLLPSWLG